MLDFKKTFNRIDELINIEFENPILNKVCNNSLGQQVGLDEDKADKVISEIQIIVECKDIYSSYEGYLNNKDKFSDLALKCTLGDINCKNPIFDNRDFLLQMNYNDKIQKYDYRNIDSDDDIEIEKNYVKSDYNEYLVEFYNNDELKNMLVDYIMESLYSLGNKDKNINIKNFNALFSIIGNKIDELTNYAVLISNSDDYNIIKGKGLFDKSIKDFKDYLINYINEDAISNELDYIIRLLSFEMNIYINKILEVVNDDCNIIVADENCVSEGSEKKEYKNPKYFYIKVPSVINFYDELNIDDNNIIIKSVRCRLNSCDDNNVLYTNKLQGTGLCNVILNGDDLFCKNNIKILHDTLLNENLNIKMFIFISKNSLKDPEKLLNSLHNYLRSYPLFSKYFNDSIYEKYKENVMISL